MRFTYKYLSVIKNAQQIKLDSFVHLQRSKNRIQD